MEALHRILNFVMGEKRDSRRLEERSSSKADKKATLLCVVTRGE